MTTAEQTYLRAELEERRERHHEALHSSEADASLSQLLTAVDRALSRIDPFWKLRSCGWTVPCLSMRLKMRRLSDNERAHHVAKLPSGNRWPYTGTELASFCQTARVANCGAVALWRGRSSS
jgi:hypothetical protein